VPREFSAHQQKIIQRYYENRDTIQSQRLAELVTELFLATPAKRTGIWKRAATAMQKLGVPATRIDHVVKSDDPRILAEVVKEMEGKN
jgi:ATP/maltotriose-dependent transcriptional regulator MalT